MNFKKNLFIIIFIFIFKTIFASEIDVFKDNKFIIKDNIKVTVKKETQNVLFNSFDVTISQPYMELIDINGNKINELKGITYSYVNALSGLAAAAVISFDMSKEASKKYEINKLKFLSSDDGYFIYYLNSITSGKQRSKKENALYAYSFGTLKTKTLSKTIASYYKNENWYYIIAQITVKNKETGKQNNYKIRLNSKIYNDFTKEIRKTYRSLKIAKLTKYFPIPIE